jgi:hypothetical protein
MLDWRLTCSLSVGTVSSVFAKIRIYTTGDNHWKCHMLYYNEAHIFTLTSHVDV